jgi:hypothetical protein
MRNYVSLGTGVALVLAALGCAQNQLQHPTADIPAASSRTDAKEQMDGLYEAPPPRNSVATVMQAKLAHAQAVLEGIALANFSQIEANAQSLKRISESGDWLVQESEAYFAFSSEFRTVCNGLSDHARAKDIKAAAADYARLSNSCVACHSYLRNERQTRDLPGRISLKLPR